VAAVARVEIGRFGKLSGMAIFMAIRAQIKLNPVRRVLTLGNVALSALNSCVPTLKRVLGRGVLFYREKRRFPPLHVMAGSTLTAIRALRELSLMRILMTVRALLERNGLFEIPVSMTLFALDRGVLAFQWILCLGVIELLIHALYRDLLPSTGRVAR
jgi:hypothetical protein